MQFPEWTPRRTLKDEWQQYLRLWKSVLPAPLLRFLSAPSHRKLLLWVVAVDVAIVVCIAGYFVFRDAGP